MKGRVEHTLEMFAPDVATAGYGPLRVQLLKWIGNKQRFAPQIVSTFPEQFGTYFEPFVGSGAVLGTLAPRRAVASDILAPLIQIWQTLAASPETVKEWYAERWSKIESLGKAEAYDAAKHNYNAKPNAPDLLYIARACYGGVVRFRKGDGAISTPNGIHNPISPESFARRVDIWHKRVRRVEFTCSDFEAVMARAENGDLVYCDPPYVRTQTILYGAQEFSLERLFRVIAECKARGVRVVLSIDGSKQSGRYLCDVPIPDGLFEREVTVDVGRSMLRRFQLKGESLGGEEVRDRLLLTY